MLVNGDEIIAKQLDLQETCEITFSDGSRTTLTPVSYIPVLSASARRCSLNGTWQVCRWPFAMSEENLCGIATDTSTWEQATQPGKVFYADPEEDPRDLPNWNRVTLDHIDPEDGAVIRRSVDVPQNWHGKKIYLRFNAIYPGGRVYVNGVLLGEHLSGLTAAEFDVSEHVSPGKQAVIAVRLLRRHKHVQLDMPRHALEFTGLAQDAFLHAVEPCHIQDFHLIPSLNADLASGTVSGTVCLHNSSSKDCSCRLQIEIRNPRTEQITTFSEQVQVKAGAKFCQSIFLNMTDVELWNDEFPRLYKAILRLEHNDQPPQQIEFATAFRRFELQNEKPLLNGKPVKFRGVNHLTYHPEYGMYTPKEWLRECLLLMKRANVNAIRTHFLGPPALAELCDEMGLYLLQELPIDWGTHFIHDPEWVGPSLQRLHGGILRDRHHPSLMVWSVGNENLPWDPEVAADGWNHLRIYDKFTKILDPSRPTMFPPPGPANKIDGIFEVRVGDIADIHYSFKLIHKMHESGTITNPNSWQTDMVTVTREQAIANGWSGVWFSSEYGIFNYQPDLLNAPYLSCIADEPEEVLSGKNTLQAFIDRLQNEWGLMRADPHCLGGAYFPWLCAGSGCNPWGWVRWGEDADWGVVTADLLPKPAFWALRVLFSPIQFPDRLNWQPGSSKITFTIHNGYNSIDLKDCILRTMMAAGGKWMGQMRSWKDIPLAGAPGEKAEVTIPIWNPQTQAALEKGQPVVCRVSILEPSGYRPITADIIVLPPGSGAEEEAMPVGPDAVLE